jgi:hypothetical protein
MKNGGEIVVAVETKLSGAINACLDEAVSQYPRVLAKSGTTYLPGTEYI